MAHLYTRTVLRHKLLSRQAPEHTSGRPMETSEQVTNSSALGGTVSKEILIGIGSITITLSLPGSATVRVLTTRSAPVDLSEATGSKNALDLRMPAAKRRRILVDCSVKENEQNRKLRYLATQLLIYAARL
ncbi:VP3 [Gyrovirus GyV7-SF]|uniref:Apoptin n=1 Tax=Gyrovirus GyV7-SF TaxID=1548711 RepID=A0A089QCI5_9VIRU|nr:VP3 [Gyrovirus GyV7-SF]AIR09407.1 VP3 [Gyrovirus GyV7-SF]